MKKHPERTAQTRENLITAFCTLYAHTPIDKITVNKVVSLAGYNRSTFYQYFDDIYAVRDAVETELLAEMKQAWQQQPEAITAPDLHKLSALFACRELYLNSLLGDYGSAHFSMRLREELLPIALGSAPPDQKELMPYILEFHLSTSLALFRAWLQSGKDIPEEKLLELIHCLYTGGVSSLIGQ